MLLTEEAGAKLKALRESLELTQSAFAHLVNLDQSRISRIEKGTAEVPYAKLEEMCARLGVGIEYLDPLGIAEVPSATLIEQAVGNTIKIHGLTYKMPRLIRETGSRRYRPSAATQAIHDKILSDLLTVGDTNEIHGFITRLRRVEETFHFYYTPADYATLRAERRLGNRVIPVYAGAIILSQDQAGTWIHRRSANVNVSPNCLHTFSGNFIADGRNRDIDLLETCRRELLEETHVAIHVGNHVPIVLFEELENSVFVVMWMGAEVEKKDAGRVTHSWEGESIFVPFDKIEEWLKRDDWREEGKAHYLAWLALNAPGAPVPFRDRAYTILRRVLERPAKI